MSDLPEVTWLVGSRDGPKAPGWSCFSYSPGLLLPWGSEMVKYLVIQLGKVPVSLG